MVRLVGADHRRFVMPRVLLAEALAGAMIAGPLEPEAIVDRCSVVLGRRWKWLSFLAARFADRFEDGPVPRLRDAGAFILEDRAFRRAFRRYAGDLGIQAWIHDPPRMMPVPAAQQWGVPPIETVAQLADWLCLGGAELLWLADLKNLSRGTPGPLRHYHYRPLMKRSGAIRLIEIPKLRLKEAQWRILTEILDRIPPHPASHGFVRGRSIKTFVTPHVGQRVVLRMDLRDFFPSFIGARIQTFFRTVGYPETVADLLGGICTNTVPPDAWGISIVGYDLRTARDLYARPHLPQGAPTSPSLANACSYRLDCRLKGLADAAGAAYTRYADDLAFSGGEDFERRVERFSTHVAAILADEGFAVQHRKTRIMRQGVRQHLAGLVTNKKANVARTDYDRLKAILTNCVRRGPVGENREGHPNFRAHLEGRVSFVEMVNPEKGSRLRSIFERIRWEVA